MCMCCVCVCVRVTHTRMEAVKHAHNAHNTCARARVRVSARTHKPVSRTHARTHSRPPAIKSSLHGRFVYVRLHTQAHTDFGLSVCSRVLHVCALWPLEYSHEQRLQPGRAASAVGASTCISMRAAAFPRTAAQGYPGTPSASRTGTLRTSTGAAV